MTAAVLVLLAAVVVLLAIAGLCVQQLAVFRAGENPTLGELGGQPTREREH